MAVPLVISFTFRFAFSFVDLVYARFLEQADVAAISYWIPFQGIYIAIWVGLSAGFTAALSNAFGHRDGARISQLQKTMRRMQCVLVPTLSALGLVLWVATPYFGLEPDLTRSFRIYGTTLMVGLPLTGFWSIHPDSVVKAHHDTRSTMMAGIWGTVTNVILNTMFVFLFGWGIFGLAFATVLSRLSALWYSVHRSRVLEARRLAEPGWDEATGRTWPAPRATILKLAVPAGLTYGLIASEGAVVNALLTNLPNSTTAIASYGVYYNFLMLALMPTVATSVAVLPYVARMIPEGHHAIVRRDLRKVSLLAAAFGVAFTIPAGVLFPAEVGAFFVPARDAETLASPLTQQVLRLLPVAALSALPFLLLRPVFEALHQPRLGIVVSVLRFLVFSFPLIVGGYLLADALDHEPLLGVVCGLIAAAALASAVTVRMCGKTLTRAARTP